MIPFRKSINLLGSLWVFYTKHREMTELDLPKGLVYVCDDEPGLIRKRRGRGFIYLDSSGNKLRDEEVINRIKTLAVPPAWKDVWICSKPNGYLQATGRDDKKRKQYRYHPDWEAYSNTTKFSHIVDFADQLPELRRRYEKDLKEREWSRTKVLALAVALIDELLLRVGNSYYSKTNKTYGLTTLRRKHVKFEKNGVHISYTGKKGSDRQLELTDNFLVPLLKDCAELPGYNLFRYKDEEGLHDIDSDDFNKYLNTHLENGLHISAKDFRTWGGTVLCVSNAERAHEICAENERKKLDTTLIRLVSKDLGNSVAICRKYYVHPDVLEYCVKHTKFEPSKKSKKQYAEFEPDEQMVLEILNKQ